MTIHHLRFGFAATAPGPSVRARASRLLATLLLWEDRCRARHKLARADTALLDDIGIDRAMADREARKPFWRV